jgi:hypothetical protein
MSFARSAIRRSSTDTIVHAVGQRVYVNRSGGGRGYVELMNDVGTTVIGRLEDGLEVMVMAWRPRGSTGTRYYVRCTGDGLEGWLGAAELRRVRTVAVQPAAAGPPTKTAPAATVSPSPHRKPRFGRR